MDAFIDIKNPGVELLARTFSSAVGKIADTNFQQTLAFLDSVSQTIEANPRDFQNVAMSLQGLTPEARRLLAAKAERVGAQAQARLRGETVEYQLLAKRNAPNAGYARILSRGDSSRRAVASSAPLSSSAASTDVPSVPSASAVSGSPLYSSSLAGSASSGGKLSSPTSRLGVSSSLSKSSDFDSSFSSSEFALADDSEEFEASIDWDDEEGSEPLYDSSSPRSLAKVGARPSHRSEALDLLDEQENNLAPSYGSAPAALATDDEETLATNDDFTIADDLNESEDDDLLVAIPGVSTSDDPASEEPGLLSSDSDESDNPDASSDEEPIYLELPDDENAPAVAFNVKSSVSSADKSEAETEPLIVSADEPEAEVEPLIVSAADEPKALVEPLIVSVDDEPEAAVQPLILPAEESPKTTSVKAADPEADVVASNEKFTAVVQESDVDSAESFEADVDAFSSLLDGALDSRETDSKSSVKGKGDAKPAKSAKNAQPTRDESWEAGWVPVANAAPVKSDVVKVAARESDAVKTTTPSSTWSRASKSSAPSVPSKFVTRRYSRPVATDSVAEKGASTYIATFDSGTAKTPQSNESATFKSPK